MCRFLAVEKQENEERINLVWLFAQASKIGTRQYDLKIEASSQ